jgi:uncharacterized protein YndB with AHSA1/START domain
MAHDTSGRLIRERYWSLQRGKLTITLIVAGVIVLVIATILAAAAAKPDTIDVQRSVTIKAGPAVVFALINDFHNWPHWAPQDRDDAAMTRVYSGASSGTGAVSDWTSRGNAGAGRMTIVSSTPDRQVEVHVDFRTPFVAHNINHFSIEPDGGDTRVTWSMHGTNVYLMKVMSLFANPDRVMGKHFMAGLSNLKTAAERS